MYRKISESQHSLLITNSEEYINTLKSIRFENDITKDNLNVSADFQYNN